MLHSVLRALKVATAAILLAVCWVVALLTSAIGTLMVLTFFAALILIFDEDEPYEHY